MSFPPSELGWERGPGLAGGWHREGKRSLPSAFSYGRRRHGGVKDRCLAVLLLSDA